MTPTHVSDADTPDGGDRFVDALAQLSFVVQGVIAQAAARRGLTIVQARLLGILRDRQVGMRELARLMSLEKSSATGLVDRAVRRGLVQREAAPGDGRSVLVTLTAGGRALAADAAAEIERSVRDLATDLAADDRARMIDLSAAIVRAHGDDPRAQQRGRRRGE